MYGRIIRSDSNYKSPLIGRNLETLGAFSGAMRTRINDRWTVEEEMVLREMASQGKSRRQIALRLRRSESGVKKRAVALGLKLDRVKRLPFEERVSHRA